MLAELHEVRSKALNEPVWYQELVHVVQTLRVQESRVCIDDLSTIDEVWIISGLWIPLCLYCLMYFITYITVCTYVCT